MSVTINHDYYLTITRERKIAALSRIAEMGQQYESAVSLDPDNELELFNDFRAVMLFHFAGVRWCFTGISAFIWSNRVHPSNVNRFRERLDAAQRELQS